MLESFHHRFRHVEPYVGFLLAAGFFSWISKRAQVFGVDTWEEAILLGSAFGFVGMFATASFLIGWRYFSPLEPPAPAETQATDSDDDIERRLANLEHNHANLRDRFVSAQAEIARLADFKRVVRDGMWADFIEQRVKSARTGIEKNSKLAATLPPIQLGRSHQGLESVVNQRLAILMDFLEKALPDDHARLKKIRTEMQERIKGDALYCSVQDSEREYWTDGSDKRSWHLRRAYFEATERFLRHLERRVEHLRSGLSDLARIP